MASKKISVSELNRAINEEIEDELTYKHDVRNLMDFCKLDTFSNHEPPSQYSEIGGECGQLMLTQLDIIPWSWILYQSM